MCLGRVVRNQVHFSRLFVQVKPENEPSGSLIFPVNVYNNVKVVPHRCNHASGPVIMQRIYTRELMNGRWVFRPCGWLCPDCRQVRIDDLS